MNDQQPDHDSLDANRVDRVTAVAKGVLGAVPLAGPAIAELVAHIIPNQRVERIVAFLRALERRLGELETQKLKERIHDSKVADLLEDGFIQAARALSEERIEHIAAIVASGLTDEARDHLHTKRMMQILAELNDVEVIILRGYSQETRDDPEFYNTHRATISGPWPHLGSPEEEIDEAAIHGSYRQHLERLGLLRPNFKRPKRGELPDLDPKTGMMKATGYQLTRLGGLLLVMLSLAEKPY